MEARVQEKLSKLNILRPGWLEQCPPTIGKLMLSLAATGFLAGGGVEADIATSLTLGLGAGVVYIAFGLLLSSSIVFERSGVIILDRVLNTETNWERHTLRSFLEIFSWLYVIFNGYKNGALTTSPCLIPFRCLFNTAPQTPRRPHFNHSGFSFPTAVTLGTCVAMPMVLLGEAIGSFIQWVRFPPCKMTRNTWSQFSFSERARSNAACRAGRTMPYP